MSAQPCGMGAEPPIVSGTRYVYDGLAAIYNANGQMESHNAAARAQAWLGSELAVKSDDHWFVTCTCYGPWNPERQRQIWEHVGPSFEKGPFCGDLRRIEKDNVEALGFPLPWQKQHLVRMSAYLRRKNLSFHEFCEQLRQRSGAEARKAIAGIVGAGEAKTISVFVRDCLHLSTFPIDTRVGQLL